jgi:hypothetical protein
MKPTEQPSRPLELVKESPRARFPHYWKPDAGTPGTRAYGQWQEAQPKLQQDKREPKRRIKDKGYNPYNSNLGLLP